MIPTVYQFTNMGTAPRFNAAFAKGCGGAEIVTDGVLRDGPIALWGEHKFWPTLAKAATEGRTWYYGDHAYFGRGNFYRITKNALQVSGAFFDNGEHFTHAMTRLQRVRQVVPVKIEPAKPSGDFVLVCPPSAALAQRMEFDPQAWTDTVTRRIKAVSKLPIRIRMKPKINRTPAPLLEALKGAHALVTFNSNAAIEATCAGYPAICTGPNPVNVFANSFQIFNRLYVAPVETRTAWAAMLCAHQWTLAEIAAGMAWKEIQ